MKIIAPKYILTCNSSFEILENHALIFDDKIKEIVSKEEAIRRYGSSVFVDENIALMPALFNAHVHFEFSGNRGELKYGSFDRWLVSVIKNREKIVADVEAISEAISTSISSGVVGFGAISSYGIDLESLQSSKAKVLYFNEAIGSNPAVLDTLFSDFLARVEDSLAFQSERFKSAIAIHSPYSVHPLLASKALNVAKERDLITSTHFLESAHEREWLDSSKGWFFEFFENFFGVKCSSNFTSHSFLEIFEGLKSPLFVHALEARDEELDKIDKLGGYIVSAPRSNRLLNNRYLDISKVSQNRLIFGTDGLSSNSTLSLFDELRAALFAYEKEDIRYLSRILLEGVTRKAAKALGFDSGTIKEGKSADILEIDICENYDIEDLAMHIILNTTKPKSIYIDGEKI